MLRLICVKDFFFMKYKKKNPFMPLAVFDDAIFDESDRRGEEKWPKKDETIPKIANL